MAETRNQRPPIETPPRPQPLQPSRISIDYTADDLQQSAKDEKVPFFRPLSQRRENTWIITLFILLHLVAFVSTMFVNNCWHNSHGDCALQSLGRFSFQPLSENPLLGPSASTLDQMGALRKTLLSKDHQFWRLFIAPLLHSGVVHLMINLCCVLFLGIHLEQEFGAPRIGVAYILSAISGSMVAALFLKDRPTITSSGSLFGLLGTVLSGLIQNWRCYTKKVEALQIFFFIFTINLILGLLPYVDNFSNIGGFISGFLLGFILLFSPKLGKLSQSKGGLYDYNVKHSVGLKQKLDRPVLRIVSLILLVLLLAGLAIAVLHGINLNQSCPWCQYVDCIPTKFWTCSDKQMYCETMVSEGRLTLTCAGNDKFKVFPFSNIPQSRLKDLCNSICS